MYVYIVFLLAANCFFGMCLDWCLQGRFKQIHFIQIYITIGRSNLALLDLNN